MIKNEIYKKAFAALCFIVASSLLMRFSGGYFGFVITLFGVCFALMQKPGKALSCYAFLIMMVVTNPIIWPKDGIGWSYSLRLGPLLIGLSLIIAAARATGNLRIPLGGIIPFMFVAMVSSVNGWVPKISYLKIINFLVFMIGIWLGTQNMQSKYNDLFAFRAMLLAIAAFFILGSLFLLPFPEVSYLSSLRAYAQGGAEEAAVAAQEMIKSQLAGDVNAYSALFCGITNQAQCLAPVMVILFSWVVCDMLFIEKQIRWPHLLLMIVAIPLLYLTRSRVALVSLLASLCMIYFYALRKIEISRRVKQIVMHGMIVFGFLLMLGAVAAEIHSDAISRWMRKTNDVEDDDRSLTEAMTTSRMGLFEYSMYEFHRSPMIGSGFQVSEQHLDLIHRSNGMILSAPIEKGLLPVMVLGETGIVGAIFFLFFIISFYVTATNRRLYVTITLFTIFFATNLGEATFFSPGGNGGMLWLCAVVGGFMMDTAILGEQQRRMREW